MKAKRSSDHLGLASPGACARFLAALVVLAIAPVLAGCAGGPGPVASTATAPGGKLSDAEYLARVRSYGQFSHTTAATLPAFTVKMCGSLASATSQFESYAALGLIAQEAQITPSQVRDLMTFVTVQGCPELSAVLGALPVRTS